MALVFFSVSFSPFLLASWEFAVGFSNCSNSPNFEAKINCNTTTPNVPKWKKTCTGSKFDLVNFNGPQMKFKNIDNFGGPCTRVVGHLTILSLDFTLKTELHVYLKGRRNEQMII